MKAVWLRLLALRLGCASSPRSAAAVRGRRADFGLPPRSEGACFCGQPVQNLCLPWAQHMGAGTREPRRRSSSKNMIETTAN